MPFGRHDWLHDFADITAPPKSKEKDAPVDAQPLNASFFVCQSFVSKAASSPLAWDLNAICSFCGAVQAFLLIRMEKESLAANISLVLRISMCQQGRAYEKSMALPNPEEQMRKRQRTGLLKDVMADVVETSDERCTGPGTNLC